MDVNTKSRKAIKSKQNLQCVKIFGNEFIDLSQLRNVPSRCDVESSKASATDFYMLLIV